MHRDPEGSCERRPGRAGLKTGAFTRSRAKSSYAALTEPRLLLAGIVGDHIEH